MTYSLIWRVQETTTQALDSVNMFDCLLDRLADYLNRRKVSKLQAEIGRVQGLIPVIAARHEALQNAVATLEVRVRALATEDVPFKAWDVLFLGLSYGVRRLQKGREQRDHEQALNRARRNIAWLANQATCVQEKIESLQGRLTAMMTQNNPSMLARVLRWFLTLKNLLSALLHTLMGDAVGALTQLAQGLRRGHRLAYQ